MIEKIARDVAERMGGLVNDDQVSPPEVLVGTMRGAISFWAGCVQEGHRSEALDILRQGLNEEITHIQRGIANGQVPG